VLHWAVCCEILQAEQKVSFEYNSYKMFSHATRHGSRYIHDEKVMAFLNKVSETSKEREIPIKKGFHLWRAQIGETTAPREIIISEDGDEASYEERCPYKQERMKPRLKFATEGRANPKGISYLYLATEKKTAMSEIRPWVGSSISIAQFRVNKDLRIINCSKFSGRQFSYIKHKDLPDNDKHKLAVWADIDNAFSEPISLSDQTSDYVPTQILAELFKSKGFDGVAYKSSLSAGFNVVLFDLDAADLFSCQLEEVESVEFKFKQADTPLGIYCVDNP
jgi:RES domain-containing protein